MSKKIKKENNVFKVATSIAGLIIVVFLVMRAEANFFIRSDMPVNLAPLDSENIDKEIRSPIIDLPPQPILFTDQQKVNPVNLRHDPQKPHAFKDRGILKAPTVHQLFNEILEKKGQAGYEIYIEQWKKRAREKGRNERDVELTDKKLQDIWTEAERINLDPFYFLAILAKEGTGSFNTLPSPGGGQPHPDFKLDVERAANLIKREIDEWKQNGKPRDWLRWVNYGNGGNTYTDGYAEDIGDPHAKPPRPAWWEAVRDVYNGPRLRVKEKK